MEVNVLPFECNHFNLEKKKYACICLRVVGAICRSLENYYVFVSLDYEIAPRPCHSIAKLDIYNVSFIR